MFRTTKSVLKLQLNSVFPLSFEATLNVSHLHDARRHHRQDEVEPDVGEDAPEGGDEEHPQVFDLAGLAVGDRPHADPDDHKHVEGGAANDGSWSQLTGLEVMTAHLDRCRGRHIEERLNTPQGDSYFLKTFFNNITCFAN